jgi:ABC-2 type transport system permease protein
MTALRVTAALTVRALLHGWRAAAAALLAVLPALLCLTVVWIRSQTQMTALTPGALWRYLLAGYMHVLAILSALLFASAAIADDVEDGSVIYLLVRPVRRGAIYLGMALAAASLAILTTTGSALLAALVLALADGQGIPVAHVARDLGWAALAALSYALPLAAVAALSRRALLLSALYLLFFEVPMAFAPTGLRLLTVSHYLLSLLPYPSPWHAVIRSLGLASPAASAALGLATILCTWSVLGALRYERREQLPG